MSFLAGLYSPKTDRLVPHDVDQLMNDELGYDLVPVYDFELLSDSLEWPGSFQSENSDRAFESYLPLLPVEDIQSIRPYTLQRTELRTLFDDERGRLDIKFESSNPSGLLDDRGSVLMEAVACDNDRNLIVFCGSSISIWSLGVCCMRNQDDFVVLLSDSVSDHVSDTYRTIGMDVCELEVREEELSEIVREIDSNDSIYNASPPLNPYFGEGVKTVSIEIALQHEEVPDAVIVPLGDPYLLGSVEKGFRELSRLDWIDSVPTIYGTSIESEPLESELKEERSVRGNLIEQYLKRKESRNELDEYRRNTDYRELPVTMDHYKTGKAEYGGSLSKVDHCNLGAAMELVEVDGIESVVTLAIDPFKEPTIPSEGGETHSIGSSSNELNQFLHDKAHD